MDKDVIISIRGMQEYADAQTDEVELLTPGRLSQGGAGYTLTYSESSLTGLSGTVTSICISGPRVTVQREGTVNTQVIFQSGKRHLSMYDTPAGPRAVGVSTRHIAADMDEQSGRIEIDYAIEVDHALKGRNVFQISYREQEGEPRRSTPLMPPPQVQPQSRPQLRI